MNSKNTLVRIQHESIENDFVKHLESDINRRILFSGPFGTGKSTFLKEFSDKQSDNYFYVKIFPVNYSVSANEDVFELIKFDLLLQLMGNYYEEIELKEQDFSLLLKSQVFIMERMKFMPLLYALIGMSEKLGQPIVDFLKALENTVEDYDKFNEEMKIDEEKDITNFLKSIENTKGSSHEMDTISELILDLIERIKLKREENDTKSVLIIDDLDRLDPEHIFRLFNIFSAHYDEINDSNKFGFDKVIFVCDIENIRKIFHHRYGAEVDFSGYIDKFYSSSPFDFDNRKYVKEKVEEMLNNIEFDSNLEFYNFQKNVGFLLNAKATILTLIDTRLLNLRMILKYPVFEVPLYSFGNYSYNSRNVPILVLFYLLKNFYGSFDILHLKLKYLYDSLHGATFKSNHTGGYSRNSEEYDRDNLISFCLAFILPEEIAFDRRDDSNKSIYLENYDCTIWFNNSRENYVVFNNFQKATRKGEDGEEQDFVLNPYKILLDTFNKCKALGYLNN